MWDTPFCEMTNRPGNEGQKGHPERERSPKERAWDRKGKRRNTVKDKRGDFKMLDCVSSKKGERTNHDSKGERNREIYIRFPSGKTESAVDRPVHRRGHDAKGTDDDTQANSPAASHGSRLKREEGRKSPSAINADPQGRRAVGSRAREEQPNTKVGSVSKTCDGRARWFERKRVRENQARGKTAT